MKVHHRTVATEPFEATVRFHALLPKPTSTRAMPACFSLILTETFYVQFTFHSARYMNRLSLSSG